MAESIKDVRTKGGWGVSQKWTNADKGRGERQMWTFEKCVIFELNRTF